MSTPTDRSVAEIVARFLVERGVDRIFGLQGGHIQPIWDHLAQLGVRIVDVRDEGAAVHMAHGHAALSGQVGIAMATAGPGVTNCVTVMANAHLERVPVLAELLGWCRERMAGYKRPRAIVFIGETEMPRTATGKILHRVLRARIAERQASP